MIHIRVDQHDDVIESLSITGHSGSAEKGKDLICAAVSAIGFGLCNALDELGSDSEIQIKENLIAITVNTADDKTETILKTGLIQLKTVQEQSSKFIEIKQREVQ